MKSEIKLYSDIPLTIDRNFAVDDIEEFLENHGGSYWRTSGNYFKHSLDASILLELKQEELDFNATNADSKNYNYCVIYNYNDDVTPIAREEVVYYFITNKKWRSKNVVELELYMDTVATLGWLKLTDRTLVHREHRDRYNVLSSSVAIPVIDKISEGINPILYKDNETIIAKDASDNNVSLLNRKWYLVYYNNDAINPTDYNQSNPVNAEFFIEPAEEDFYYAINTPLLAGAHTIGTPNEFLLIPYPLKNGTGNLAGAFSIKINYTVLDCYVKLANDNYLKGKGYKLTGSGSSIIAQAFTFTIDAYGNVSTINWGGTTTYSTNEFYLQESAGIVYAYSVENDFYNNSTIVRTIRESNTLILRNIDYVDKTDSRVIKIIEFPYCPIPIELYDAYNKTLYFKKPLTLGGSYDGVKILESNMLDKNISVNYSFTDVKAYPDDLVVINPSTKNSNENKNIAYETKLFNSEIFNYKVVYDSFSSLIQLENISLNAALLSSLFNFDFVVSKNISSTFIIDYSKSFPNSSNTDYENLLIVKRNNEMQLYTSQYINYLRTGYNYDVKAKERREQNDLTRNILTAIGGIAGVGIGFASGNPAVAIGSVIGAGTSITSSIVSSVENSVSAAQAIDAKLAQTRAQAVNVSQCDELSLLEYYTKSNKAKLVTYKPSASMKNNLFNLFFYLGYKTELMKIPDLNSRLRFNFIQADIDIELTSISNTMRNISDEILKDYKARFAVGLTIFHKYKNSWNFEQDKENWETVFKNYLS